MAPYTTLCILCDSSGTGQLIDHCKGNIKPWVLVSGVLVMYLKLSDSSSHAEFNFECLLADTPFDFCQK